MRITSKKNRVDGPLAKSKQKSQQRPVRFTALTAMVFSSMVAALIGLAGWATVPQVTRAPGTIVPTGDYTQIEVMDGGIVDRVYVQDGDQVHAGSVLVELSHPDLSTEQQRLRKQIATLDRKLAHERTILKTLENDYTLTTAYLTNLRRQNHHRAAATLEIYAESQRMKRVSILQQQETLEILNASHSFTLERVARKKAELDRSHRLHEQGLTTARDLARDADQLDALRTAASEGEARLAQARNTLAMTEADLAEQTLALREETLNKLEEFSDLRSELDVSLRIVNQRLDGLRVIAPKTGIVQSVAFPNQGEIIAPGETVFELLPSQLDLMVEARIPNSEIGYVNLDQPVSVTVDTYDTRRFGKAKGRIVAVSPVPLMDDQTGDTYFRASIQLKDQSIGAGAYKRPLQAGMTVVAEMTTNENTLLAYMLKPIHQTMQNAFFER